MKKKLMSVLIAIMLLLVSMTAVNAATPKVTITSTKNDVKPGETFTVVVSAECDEGINGLNAKLVYNAEVLELQNASPKDSNWSFLGSGDQIFLINNSTSKITNADLYTMTFKVKDNAKVGNESVIFLDNVMLDTDAETNSNKSVSVPTILIKVIDETTNNNEQNNQNSENTGNTENTNNEQTSGNNSNTTNQETNNVVNDITNNVTNNTTNNVVNNTTIENITKDETTKSESKLPNTGDNLVIILSLSLAVVVAIIAYKTYKNV